MKATKLPYGLLRQEVQGTQSISVAHSLTLMRAGFGSNKSLESMEHVVEEACLGTSNLNNHKVISLQKGRMKS